MKTIFVSQDLWSLVESGFTKPKSITNMSENDAKLLKENIRRDAKALHQLQEGVSNSIFPRIMRALRAKQAWDILQQEYQGDIKVRTIKLQNLRRDFENMKMKENESLNDFSTIFFDLINQMKTYSEEISDGRIVEKILISLPEKFDSIVAVIEETKDISKMSIQELMCSLKSYDQRLSRCSEKPLESAFQSKLTFSYKNAEKKFSTHEQSKGDSSRSGKQGRGRCENSRGRGRYSNERRTNDEESSQKCNICKMTNHVEKVCWFKGKPQCHNCKKFGYVQKDCQLKTNQQASFMEEKEGEGNLFYACQAATEKKNDVWWFLDSGCSNHMTSNKSIFLDMDTSINSQVKMGNEALVQVQGKDTIGI